MDSLSFRPGTAYLFSNSPQAPWAAVFEDEGSAGYFYAYDRSRGTGDRGILDAMLIYNVASLEEPERERLAAVQWSADGLQAVLYLDGTAQALLDFAVGESCCRLNFPNFMEQGEPWRKDAHAWEPARLERFEAALYK